MCNLKKVVVINIFLKLNIFGPVKLFNTFGQPVELSIFGRLAELRIFG